MSYQHTIALSRDLLAEGHFEAVEQIVQPLIERPDMSATEEAAIRSLAAAAAVLGSQDYGRSAALLLAYRSFDAWSGLQDDVRVEVAIWLGWTVSRAASTRSERCAGLTMLAEASRSAREQGDTTLRAWALVASADALDSMGGSRLAAALLPELSTLRAALRHNSLARWICMLDQRLGAASGRNGVKEASGQGRRSANSNLKRALDLLHLAVADRIPALIVGEAGVGKAEEAISAVAKAGTGEAIVVRPNDYDDAVVSLKPGAAVDDAPLVLIDIDRLSSDQQQDLISRYDAASFEPAANRVIVSTASRELMGLARSGLFHPELALRLGCLRIDIAPLRERTEDVQVLIDTVLKSSERGMPTPSLTPQAFKTLRTYAWPGNDRELSKLLVRLRSSLAVDPSPVIGVEHLPEAVGHEPDGHLTLQRWIDKQLMTRNRDLDQVLAQAERILIESTLLETSGQVTAAADLLGLTRQGLYKKMKRLDVDPGRFHDAVAAEGAKNDKYGRSG